MTVKRIAWISDIQAPFFHEAAVKNLGKFLRAYKPHQTICIGDEIDLPQLGGFAQPWQEVEGNIDEDRKLTLDILQYLGVTDVVGSNHGARVYKSLSRRLPAFMNLPELKYDKFMGYDKAGIRYHPNGFDFAPGWHTCHGDAFPLSNKPGQTALNGAMRMGKSVVSGHTHRLGLSAHSEASGGRYGRIVWGVEVGNLVDLSSPGMGYTRGYANWQMGFVVGTLIGKRFTPELIPIDPKDGSFVYQGKVYGRAR
jgi:predicted phosphodiesterase